MNLELDAINSAANLSFTNLPSLISSIVAVLLPLAGIILLGVIIFAGFQMLTGASDPKKVDSAKNMLTTALMGFGLLFAAYWIAQILETVFNFPILGK